MLNACELAIDLQRAAQWCRVADDFIDSYGCPFLYAECRTLYGSILAARGRWADADRELAAALHITAGADPGMHARALSRLADLRVRQGRLEEADRLLSELDERTHTEATLSLAALLLARGDSASARSVLEQRFLALDRHPAHSPPILELLVDAHLAAGSPDAAAAAAERLGELAVATSSARVAASAAAARGRVSLARGDHEAGVPDLEAALALWSQLELPFETARTRLEMSRALAESHPELAIDHARRALAAFEGLGAAVDTDRVAAFLRSLGITARTGIRGAGTLTLREREVLSLLGLGLSNPEIAERLYITRKTASHHVSNILTKLNLRNRAEAAACAVQMQDRAVDPPSSRR